MRAVALCALLAIACGDDDATTDPRLDGAVLLDDGGASDAGAFDAPSSDAGSDAGPPPPPLHPMNVPGVTPGAERYEDPDDVFNAASCYDGEDNDARDMAEADGFDCDDSNCATLPSCCVARPQAPETCCQPTSGGDALSSLGSCTPGGSPLECITDAMAFGAPTPFVDDGLALGGDGVYDSGLLFDAPVDLRTSNLDVRIRFRQAVCTGSCRESAAFGITTQEALGAQSHVDPEVALVVSGERREARLLIADDPAAVWNDVGDGEWHVVLRPDGDVLVGRDGSTPTLVATYQPVANARVVAWGHSRNPGATGDDGIRILELDPTVEVCDMPRGWSARQQLVLQVTDEVDTAGARSPSVVVDAAGMPRLAFEQGGNIYLGVRENPERLERWARDASEARADAADPELVRTDEGFRLYYFSGTELSSTWMVANADASLDNLDVGTPLTVPAVGFAHPSIVPISPPDRTESFAMAATISGGIGTFSSEDGLSWTPHGAVPIELLEAAEVGEPSLVVLNGGYQLAVPLRRGARWSVAIFASAELLAWRLVDERALEAGEGTERVGVRDLELFVNDDMLEAVYVGSDGVRETLHHAARRVPSLF